jgi:hypothetical protein
LHSPQLVSLCQLETQLENLRLEAMLALQKENAELKAQLLEQSQAAAAAKEQQLRAATAEEQQPTPPRLRLSSQSPMPDGRLDDDALDRLRTMSRSQSASDPHRGTDP